MTNILYLHNGNIKVKEWIVKQWPTHRCMPCFVEEWDIGDKKISSFDDKFEYLSAHNNIVFDLTSADNIPNLVLAELSKFCKVIKICTSYSDDIENLESVWNQETYDYNQWQQALLMRLWIADQIIHIDGTTEFVDQQVVDQKKYSVVFTPGRCGSYVLMDVVKVSTLLHHSNLIIYNKEFKILVNSDKIFSVLRKSFFKQVVSDAIADDIKLVVSYRSNPNLYKDLFLQKSIEIKQQHIEKSFDKIANFVDLLLGLKMFCNKKIQYCYFEDLSKYFDQVQTVKNPYDAKNLIANYESANSLIEKNYQFKYQKILDKLELVIGSSIY